MPEVAGVVMDPSAHDADGNVRQAGSVFAVLEDGQVWGINVITKDWIEFPPIPNTPAAGESGASGS